MTYGKFQRSEDGKTWKTISPSHARAKLSGYYRNVDDVIAAMNDGQVVRTPYAVYRFIQPQTSDSRL